jgi:tRNA dimethylallyltransferase
MIAGMKKRIKQFALIGPTASGKSSLAVELALELDALILSLDSLSVYREIEIASAKPKKKERGGIPHYGIDLIDPDEPFDVTLFSRLYREVFRQAGEEGKHLIIVGGTGFYLKVLIDGISTLPPANKETSKKVEFAMQDRSQAHTMLTKLDPDYMGKIAPGDTYRIEKALQIYFSTGEKPSYYFRTHPPVPAIEDKLPIYRIEIDKPLLRERIAERTGSMLEEGLIDEVAFLEKKYSRSPKPMGAIGIIETLGYLDGYFDRDQLTEKISIHTARLAKRQTTFNRSQFAKHIAMEKEDLKKLILKEQC